MSAVAGAAGESSAGKKEKNSDWLPSEQLARTVVHPFVSADGDEPEC